MSEIVVGCFQFEVVQGDVRKNLAKVENALPFFAKNGCRLLVLPEMFSSGFAYPTLREMAERSPAVLEKISKWALEFHTVIVGSLPERDGNEIYNTSYVVNATGEITGTYRKIHLFSLHNEHHYFASGNTPLVCSTDAGRLGIAICYDLRFPELARNLAMKDAMIFCVSALWPAARIEHWSLLLRVRAIENQFFVIGCNGCGLSGRLEHGGASAIISPTGKILQEADNEETRMVANLQLNEMAAFRQQIPCLKDRRPDTYAA